MVVISLYGWIPGIELTKKVCDTSLPPLSKFANSNELLKDAGAHKVSFCRGVSGCPFHPTLPESRQIDAAPHLSGLIFIT